MSTNSVEDKIFTEDELPQGYAILKLSSDGSNYIITNQEDASDEFEHKNILQTIKQEPSNNVLQTVKQEASEDNEVYTVIEVPQGQGSEEQDYDEGQERIYEGHEVPLYTVQVGEVQFEYQNADGEHYEFVKNEECEVQHHEVQEFLDTKQSDELQSYEVQGNEVLGETQVLDFKNLKMAEYIKSEPESDDEVIVVLNENGESNFFKLQDENLVQLNDDEKLQYSEILESKLPSQQNKSEQTHHKNRISCEQCGKVYKSIGKYMKHMKNVHQTKLNLCKICSSLFDDETEYQLHLRFHVIGEGFTCDTCGAHFKTRGRAAAHVRGHVTPARAPAFICDTCGAHLHNEEEVSLHMARKHSGSVHNYTCFYCGKGYKGLVSFEAHVNKHETNNANSRAYICEECGAEFPLAVRLERHMMTSHPGLASKHKRQPPVPTTTEHRCHLCDRCFADARALTWHMRLHTNERPFSCHVCARRFVTLNRRNQHTLTAHTQPGKRCPLCPAVFHLTSMVNSHIKKVHLRNHRRRTRAARPGETAREGGARTVTLQELSVAVQNELLELRTSPIN